MIRTLTLVSVLVLAAGLALGFFVAEARGRTAPTASVPAADLVLERKVDAYVRYYSLSPDRAQEVRTALREYDQQLADLFRKLRSSHKDEFRALTDRANTRIRAVLDGKR